MFVYERINLESSTKLKQLDAPLHLFIKVTGKCMAKCSFCSQGGSHQAQMTNSYLHKVLGVVFQDFKLFPFSVRENIELNTESDRERLENSIEKSRAL